MASKNKKQVQSKAVKNEMEARKKVADYIFAFLAVLLIISMIFSAFVTY